MKTTVAELIKIAKTCFEVTLFPYAYDYPNDDWRLDDDDDDYGYETFFDYSPKEYDTALLEDLGGDPNKEVECFYELIDRQRWNQIPMYEGIGTREQYLQNIGIDVDDDLNEEDDNYQSMLLAIINPIEHETIYGTTEYGDRCHTEAFGKSIYWVLNGKKISKYGVKQPGEIEIIEDDDNE